MRENVILRSSMQNIPIKCILCSLDASKTLCIEERKNFKQKADNLFPSLSM